MKWSKPSEELVTLLDTKLVDIDCEKRKMFGQWAYFFNGNMFIGVYQSDIFIRLSPERKDEVFQKYPDTKPFEPRSGYIMREYAVLPPSLYENDKILTEVIGYSIEYMLHLPPKKKKPKKSKK